MIQESCDTGGSFSILLREATGSARSAAISMVWLVVVVTILTTWGSTSVLAGKFWHITDLHLDWNYVVGGNTKDMCHRGNTTDPEVRAEGNYNCDAPEVLVMALLTAMQRIEPHPDFILWTGDSGPHYWTPTPSLDYITNVTKTVFTELDRLFPGATVFPALGNHDSDPPDTYYDYANKTAQNGTSQYDKYWKAGAFGDHIGNGANMRETFKRCGYYMKLFTTKKGHITRIIVLNTNLYYNNNATEVEPVVEDPCDQLAWLEARLNETLASQSNDSIYIASHVPPGAFERNPRTNNFFTTPRHFVGVIEKRFVELVSRPRFAERIQAHFYGHVHTDSFRLFLDRGTRQEARGVAFLGVSGTPLRNKFGLPVGVDPGMRLFEFSDDDGTLLDYKQYGISLDKAALSLEESSSRSSKSRRKLDPVDPELSPTTAIAETSTPVETATPTDTSTAPPRQSRQANSSDPGAEKKVAVIRVNSTDEFTNALLGKSPSQFAQSAQLLGLEQNNDSSLLLAANTTDTMAQLQPLKTNSTADAQPEVASSSVALISEKGSDVANATGNATGGGEDEALIQQMADQFQLVYSARAAFKIQNLTAGQFFQAFKTMSTKEEGGSQSQIFQEYYAHNTNGRKAGDGSCDSTCYREHLCTISNLLRDELTLCLNSTEDFLLYAMGPSAPIPLRPASQSAPGGAKPLRPTNQPASAATTTTTTTPPAVVKPIRQSSTPPPQPIVPAAQVPGTKIDDHNTDDDMDDDKVDFRATNDGSVQAKPIEGEDITTKATAIFFSLLGVAILLVVGALAYKRYRANRFRNQEFLLTDSVFRYDGYSQLDDF